MRKSILIIFFALLLFNCGSSKTDAQIVVDELAFTELKQLVNKASFRIDAESAYPMQSSDVIDVTNVLMRQTENVGGRMSLSGNEDFLLIRDNSAKANLSYFGELRTAGYSDQRDTSIIFDNKTLSYEVTENDKKKQLLISFKVRNDVEQFMIKMVVFSNQYANISIYGSNRTAIRYRGKLKEID